MALKTAIKKPSQTSQRGEQKKKIKEQTFRLTSFQESLIPLLACTNAKRKLWSEKQNQFTRHCFYYFIQLGVCPICLESGGQSMPCFQAHIHGICLQDWIWQGVSIECPCCKQNLPPRLIQQRLVEPPRHESQLYWSKLFLKGLSLGEELLFHTLVFNFSLVPIGLRREPTKKISRLGNWW